MGCGTSNANPTRALSEAKVKQLGKELGILVDGEELDIRKVCLLMWKSRDLPEMVQLISDLVANHSDEKEIFDGIEFYLPQFAHMVINLEVNWGSSTLEHFALMVSQQSTHFALQLHFILVAAMEDFQPEDEFGNVNPNANPLLYLRCATLLHNVERSVVFGSPRARDFEKMYHAGQITLQELQELQRADRKFAAAQISDETKASDDVVMEGVLGYKRWARKGLLSSKGWHDRRFVLQHRVLLCFRIEDGVLKRAIPLAHTTIVVKEHHTKGFYFEIQENKRDRVFKLYAPDAETRTKWVEALRAQAAAPPANLPHLYIKDELSDAEIARYGFFRSEREFVRSLTDICEEMRFIDPKDRKPELKVRLDNLSIPGCVYLPLCKSTDPWSRVVRVISEKGHPFSTRKRCPCLMTFEIKFEAPDDTDVATYLFETLSHSALSSTESETSQKALIWDVKIASPANDGSDTKDQQGKPERKGTIKKGLGDRAAQLIQKSLSTSSEDQGSTSSKKFKANDEKTEDRKEGEEKNGTANANNTEASSSMANMVDNIMKSPFRTKLESSVDRKAQYKIIAKSHDDLRQEVFCMQLIQFLKDIWSSAKLELLLRPYRILSTSKSTGVLEVVDNANSIDGVKKSINQQRLIEYFRQRFTNEEDLANARRLFTRSLAGYSMACYILSIKDRHNGNIMLCDDGSVVHIDFGFLFGQAPGKDKVPHTNFSFERAEFKLTSEMLEVIGGLESQNWKDFVTMMTEGLRAARKHKDTLISLVEIMGYKSNFPCFQQPGGGVNRVIRELEARLLPSIHDDDLYISVKKMTDNSLDHKGTLFYGKFIFLILSNCFAIHHTEMHYGNMISTNYQNRVLPTME